MKKIIGLDVSSSCVGFSVFEYDKTEIKLIRYGHIKPPDSKKGTIIYRVFEYVKELRRLYNIERPDAVAIENYASGFSPGRTTAKTIIILATFNSISQMICLESLGYEPEMMAVSHIRSVVAKFIKRKSLNKEEVLEAMKTQFSLFIPRISKNGSIGAEAYDESDAICVGFAYCVENQNK